MYSIRTLIPVLLLITVTAGALAMWSDTLKISATVETGEVDVEFVGTPAVYEGSEYGKSWVASCSATLVDVQNEDEGNPTGDNDAELVIHVTNAYPCYYCKVNNVVVKNTGTIPVKLKIVGVYADGISCKLMSGYEPKYSCDVDGNGEADLIVWGCFTSLEGYQLEPGDTKSFSVDLHVEQDAEESSEYVIKIIIKGIQWNEYS